MTEPKTFFAEGALSLRAVLSTGSREIYEIFTLAPKKTSGRHAPKERDVVLELARARGIAIRTVTEDFFAQHATGTSHGGLLARVGEKKLVTPEELVSQQNPFLSYLCGIEDPYNFASCLRTLYLAGCNGVFLPRRNWMSAGAIIPRASAGASECLRMAEIPEDADTFLALLASHGISPVCARQRRAQNLYQTALCRPLCLILGGERRGIDATLDQRITRGIVIPYAHSFHASLSAQAACAAISFEILRQQEEHKA